MKRACWHAMDAVKDGQYKHGPSVAALGYIEDLLLHDLEPEGVGEEDGGAAAVVEVVMVMPTRGRPKHMTVGLDLEAALMAVPGVRGVEVKCTWAAGTEWGVRNLSVAAHDTVFGKGGSATSKL